MSQGDLTQSEFEDMRSIDATFDDWDGEEVEAGYTAMVGAVAIPQRASRADVIDLCGDEDEEDDEAEVSSAQVRVHLTNYAFWLLDMNSADMTLFLRTQLSQLPVLTRPRTHRPVAANSCHPWFPA